MREEGWYWVKLRGEWEIKEWSSFIGRWVTRGLTADLYDSQWEEIDERKIIREDED